MVDILVTDFGTFDLDAMTQDERRDLADKIRAKISEVKRLYEEEQGASRQKYLKDISAIKKQAGEAHLFDCDDTMCLSYVCPKCMPANEETGDFGINMQPMPTVPIDVLAGVVQDRFPGVKFTKPINVKFIRDAGFIPADNEIIIDLVLNNDREQFHKSIIHELLHKLSWENKDKLRLEHNDIFPLQNQIYDEVQSKFFPKSKFAQLRG